MHCSSSSISERQRRTALQAPANSPKTLRVLPSQSRSDGPHGSVAHETFLNDGRNEVANELVVFEQEIQRDEIR